MKTLLTLLLLTLAYPSLALAQIETVSDENGYVTFKPEPLAYQTPAAAGTPLLAAPSIAPAAAVTDINGEKYVTFTPQPLAQIPLATGEAAHTPMSEVVRVIGLLPKPEIAFVDFGCGYDARWCVAAAEKWGCKCVGIELDSQRAAAARERVRNLGLDRLITIVEGDAGTVPVSGDVAVVYLYPSMLTRLKPRLLGFKAFASYLHQPAGINCTKNGDTWFYQRQVQVAAPQGAVWGGMVYSQPVCNSPNCSMCNSIRQQLWRR